MKAVNALRLPPSLPTVLWRGLQRRCPKCGTPGLLHSYLKVTPACGHCGEAYGHFRADDMPPWVTGESSGGAQAMRQPTPQAVPQPAVQAEPALPDPRSFAEVVALFRDNREVLLQSELELKVHLVHFEPARIEFHPGPGTRPDLASQIGRPSLLLPACSSRRASGKRRERALSRS